jgi:hypothetical protein
MRFASRTIAAGLALWAVASSAAEFGVYKDGDVIGNTNVNPNSLQVQDKAGGNGDRVRWKP